MKAIKEIPAPTTKKGVRSFLGMIGYYRRFIPHFATKAEPLTNLTRKGLPEQVERDEHLDDAFQTLKKDLAVSYATESGLLTSISTTDRCLRYWSRSNFESRWRR